MLDDGVSRMLFFVKAMLVVLGLAAVSIGLSNFLIGPDFTASVFGTLLNFLINIDGYSGGLEHPNIDNEMRFYSVFWIAYGAFTIWLSSRLETHFSWVLAVLGLFFMGGIGRIISYSMIGRPDTLFVMLMYVEIIGPVMVLLCLLKGLEKI